MDEREMIKMFTSLFNDVAILCVFMFISQVLLAVSVYTSAKSRNVSNPLLYFAITLFGGGLAGIIYVCSKDEITRTEEKPRSLSVLWLVLSFAAFVVGIVLYLGAFSEFFSEMMKLAATEGGFQYA